MNRYDEYDFFIDDAKVLIPELDKNGDLIYIDEDVEVIKEVADDTVITYGQLKDAFKLFAEELKKDLISLYEKIDKD